MDGFALIVANSIVGSALFMGLVAFLARLEKRP